MTTIARVLVVDDDTAVARLLARLIETRPYTCVVAHSAAEALGVLEERGLRRHRRREPGHISTEKYH